LSEVTGIVPPPNLILACPVAAMLRYQSRYRETTVPGIYARLP
jgi:hypothetical protein